MEAARQNRYCTRKAGLDRRLLLRMSRDSVSDAPDCANKMIDRRLLDILCCPVTKSPVRLLSSAELEALNRSIAEGALRTEVGASLKGAAMAGLITRDGRTIYRIEDDIPVMLADEAIATAQIADFPRV
jgi:uncharacterized protein YbaR (Trm112 family)